MRAWIINIGDEILTGKVLNWNAYWIAKRLTSIGVQVRRIICIPDDPDTLARTIEDAMNDAELIITTGGLGPTPGDITIEGLRKATNRKLVLDHRALEFIRKRYRELYSLGLVNSPDINEAREKMARIPEGADVVYNDVGVSPAIILDINSTTIIALPGPPPECMYLLEKIIPRIKSTRKLFSAERLIDMSDESVVAEFLSQVKQVYPDVNIKTYPLGFGQDKLLVIAIADDERKANDALEMLIKLIRNGSG